MRFIILLTTLIAITPNPCFGKEILEDTECGDGWVAFKDEKCFKLLNSLVVQSEAAALCAAESAGSTLTPPLLTIKSADEQEFLTKFIFEDSEIVDNVWLGAYRKNDTYFTWSDGSEFEFTHWRTGTPTNHSENGCVQITAAILRHQNDNLDSKISTNGEDDGYWTDVSCAKRNLVICQKLPTWSILQLQKTVIELKRNPVPIGFVYVQLPGQPDANTTWPNLGWEDVTSAYGGLFFRAEGGEAAAFGNIQDGQTSRVISVSYLHTLASSNPNYPFTISLPESGWSPYVRAGEIYASSGPTKYYEALRFETSGGEVRPKNTAVRIWKRVY